METDPTSSVYSCPSCGNPETNPDLPRPGDPELLPYPIYHLCLLCKDDSTAATDRVFKLYYYSHEKGQDVDYLFSGLNPTNLYQDDITRGSLLQYLTLITRFNVYLELGIRRKIFSSFGQGSSNGDLFMIENSKIKSLDLNN